MNKRIIRNIALLLAFVAAGFLLFGCDSKPTKKKSPCIVEIVTGTDIQWLPMPDGTLMPITYRTYESIDTCVHNR